MELDRSELSTWENKDTNEQVVVKEKSNKNSLNLNPKVVKDCDVSKNYFGILCLMASTWLTF